MGGAYREGKVWLRSERGLQGKEDPVMGSQVPQGLLVQGAVEAVDLLLAVLPDGVHAGSPAHHLQHVAGGAEVHTDWPPCLESCGRSPTQSPLYLLPTSPLHWPLA